MTSTAPLPVPTDTVVPSRPSLSLVPAGAVSAAARSLAPVHESPDPSAPAANRPRFRRLVVFTGQLS